MLKIKSSCRRGVERAQKRSPKVLWMQALEDCEGALTRDQYEVGNFVSTDKSICKMPRHLLTRYGQESQDCCYQGSTIYNYAASALIGLRTKSPWVQMKLSCWERPISNNSFRTSVFPRLNIIMVTMASSLLRSIIMNELKKVKHNLFQVLVPSTKMLVLNRPFK